MEKAQDALFAIKQKFPSGVSDVSKLSEEQKSWLQVKIQVLTKSVEVPSVEVKLKKIRNRLIHATEDIPDGELQKIISFVFENFDAIMELVKN